MTREPEWDDYTRSRVMALQMWEAQRCPNCGNYDVMVELKSARRLYVWDEHNGERIEVSQFQCLACGAADVIKRDFAARHEKDQPTAGQAAAADGRMFVTRPLIEEVP